MWWQCFEPLWVLGPCPLWKLWTTYQVCRPPLLLKDRLPSACSIHRTAPCWFGHRCREHACAKTKESQYNKVSLRKLDIRWNMVWSWRSFGSRFTFTRLRHGRYFGNSNCLPTVLGRKKFRLWELSKPYGLSLARNATTRGDWPLSQKSSHRDSRDFI